MPMFGKVKPCKYCQKTSHYSWQCFHRSKVENIKVQRLKKGKIGKQWDLTREKWFKEHPDAYFECYLKISPRCPGTIPRKRTTLDHIKSRSRYPELRFTQSNLAPCCWPCNTLKGSKDVTQVKEITHGRN